MADIDALIKGLEPIIKAACKERAQQTVEAWAVQYIDQAVAIAIRKHVEEINHNFNLTAVTVTCPVCGHVTHVEHKA